MFMLIPSTLVRSRHLPQVDRGRGPAAERGPKHQPVAECARRCHQRARVGQQTRPLQKLEADVFATGLSVVQC